MYITKPTFVVPHADRSFGAILERRTRRSDAIQKANGEKQLGGEPNLRQLKPDGELAKPAPGASRSRIVKRAGVYESLPAEWAMNSVASFATERRLRRDRGARHEVIAWRSRRRTAHC
jgi:hypothetical protein